MSVGGRYGGIDAKLAAELAAWKLQQKPERREDDSLVIATATGEPLSASNFLSRDFRPALRVRLREFDHFAVRVLPAYMDHAALKIHVPPPRPRFWSSVTPTPAG